MEFAGLVRSPEGWIALSSHECNPPYFGTLARCPMPDAVVLSRTCRWLNMFCSCHIRLSSEAVWSLCRKLNTPSRNSGTMNSCRGGGRDDVAHCVGNGGCQARQGRINCRVVAADTGTSGQHQHQHNRYGNEKAQETNDQPKATKQSTKPEPTLHKTPSSTHLLKRAVHVADAAHVLEADEARLALVLGYLVGLLPEGRRPRPSVRFRISVSLSVVSDSAGPSCGPS